MEIQLSRRRLLHLSKRGTEIAGHVETAAQPGIAEAQGELDATAAKDDKQARSLATSDAIARQLVLDPSDSVRVGSRFRSLAARGCPRRARLTQGGGASLRGEDRSGQSDQKTPHVSFDRVDRQKDLLPDVDVSRRRG